MDFVHLQREQNLCTRKTVSSLCCMCCLWSVVQCFKLHFRCAQSGIVLYKTLNSATKFQIKMERGCGYSVYVTCGHSNISLLIKICAASILIINLWYLLHDQFILIVKLLANVWGFLVITNNDILLSQHLAIHGFFQTFSFTAESSYTKWYIEREPALLILLW